MIEIYRVTWLAILITVALGFVASPASAQGSWSLKVSTDAMTDQERRAAVTSNAQGHSLSVYRVASGQVWMNFRLSDETLDLISSEKLIDYRIDKHEATSLGKFQSLRNLGVVTSEWEPKWVNFLVWHGKESEGRGKIGHMLNGSKFLVRYYLATGGYKDTSFSLEGSGPAIAKAIGISEVADAATEELANRVHAARMAYIKQCPTEPIEASLRCRRALSTCTPHAKDADAFEHCIAGLNP